MYKSQQKANAKYDKLHMKQIAMKMKIEEAEKIQQIALMKDMSTSLFCRKCIKYCIDNNIDLSEVDI